MTQANKMKKRIWLRVLLIAIGIIIIFTLVIILTSLSVAKPTKGEAIVSYDNPKSALLVIDVQNDTTSNTSYYGNTTSFVESVNQAITYAENNGMEILYVKNITSGNPIIQLLSQGKYRKGTNGVELDSNLYLVNDHIFEKSIGDSFSSNDFEEYLAAKEVDTLYIVGADAAGCVYSTAGGGLNRAYNVNIIKDAIITVNNKTMAQMLVQYEKDGIKIIDLVEFQEITHK